MKYCCFDIGNVCAIVDLEKFTNELDEYLRAQLVPHKINAMTFLENLQPYHDLGLSSIERSLQNEYNISGKDIFDICGKNLLEIWNTVVEPNNMMLNFIDSLRQDNVKIAILSNIGPEHSNYLRSSFPRLFKDAIQHLSYEVGARKPTKLYYQSFLLENPDFNGAIYLDDRDENVAAGNKYGLKSIKFELDQLLKLSAKKQKEKLGWIKLCIDNDLVL